MHARIGLATNPPVTKSTASRRLLDRLMSRLVAGSLAVSLPNGEQAIYHGRQPGPAAAIRIERVRAFRRLLTGGDIGFARAYIDGDWRSDDLVALIEFAARNQQGIAQVARGSAMLRLLDRAVHLLRRNSRRGSRRNIAAHYDLGNDFYRLWLDPTMTYSAGLYAAGDDDLESAQHRKYARMAELADLRPDHHVLEIGCGWGGFCTWAATHVGCRVTAITISREQFDYTRGRVAATGLTDKIDVRLIDYRDLDGEYDRIVSIEMLEAVGEQYWPTYFTTLRDRLTPGGRAAIQVITIADDVFPAYRARADFVQRYIFPGGMLPSPSALRAQTAAAGLTWRTASDHGTDYARTLAAWRERFEGAWPQIAAQGFDDRFHRKWRYYLAYCEAGFNVGRVGLLQLALTRD